MNPPSLNLRNATRPPVRWKHAIDRVLISRQHIAKRIRELARDIEHDAAGRELLLIPLLSGTVLFIADLVRQLHLPIRLDFMGISSYRDSTHPGALTVTKDLRLNPSDCDVLVVDDILDTGQTLACALARLRALRPRTLKTCVLLDKRVHRRNPIQPDYIGFRIPNAFVVGYGLDHAEQFRHLPFIGVLKQ